MHGERRKRILICVILGDMIDLGDELADYGDEPEKWTADGFPINRGPAGMHTFGKLADLQKGGFNVNPRTGRGLGDPHRDVGDPPSWVDRISSGIAGPLPDPLTDNSRWTFAGMIDDDSLTVKTWLPEDEPVPTSDSRTITVQIGGGTNLLVDALRSDKPLVDYVSVPNQPFDWKPQITATHRGKPINPVCEHGRMIWSCWACIEKMT